MPLYTSYAFPDRDTEQQLNLGGGMKTISDYPELSQALIAGVGYGTISFLYNTLANVWPINASGYLLSLNPQANLEFGGGECTAQRFFIQFTVAPNPEGSTASPATDVSMSVSVLVLCIQKNPWASRGLYP